MTQIEARDPRASLEIDLNALAENYRATKTLIPGSVSVLSVVKADAYGHGSIQVARRLEEAGTDYFGVATLVEGIDLRVRGISKPILILSSIMPWDEIGKFVEYDLTATVVNFEELDLIAGSGGKGPLKAHIKFDTGMGRLGFVADELPELVSRLGMIERIRVEGVMTHFSSSENRDEFGLEQIARFSAIRKDLKSSGIDPLYFHMANSGAICNYPESYFEMVRPGIMLYGSYPDASLHGKIKLKPVMTWRSSISFVRNFPAKTALSYGRTYITEKASRIAYIPVGYADGYPRSLSNNGSVLIRGTLCPIRGRICMDWILADATVFPDIAPAEEVVLLGDGGRGRTITADEIAQQAGTIPYEILCGISRRIPRSYV
jgi:alanine racemase